MTQDTQTRIGVDLTLHGYATRNFSYTLKGIEVHAHEGDPVAFVIERGSKYSNTDTKGYGLPSGYVRDKADLGATVYQKLQQELPLPEGTSFLTEDKLKDRLISVGTVIDEDQSPNTTAISFACQLTPEEIDLLLTF